MIPATTIAINAAQSTAAAAKSLMSLILGLKFGTISSHIRSIALFRASREITKPQQIRIAIHSKAERGSKKAKVNTITSAKR